MLKLDSTLDFVALDALLQSALDLPAEQRDQFAIDACADDVEKLATLRDLLTHCDDSQTQWQRLPQDYAAAGAELGGFSKDQAPEQIGDWTVHRLLGEGGMAQVYLAARQLHGARQQAAIKLLSARHTGTDLRIRFERERRILANLSDPRIARFYDAGTLADGRPWLAMEYVEGVRIDQWCDIRKSSIEERIRLLIQVAQATASAHSRLIVHRDIKPANVLVDAQGAPKLLDFGIAKVLDPDEASDGAETHTEQRLLTPHYASPEQLLGESVGTSSDIYQLGLMLYELCTGRRPFAQHQSSLPRMMSAITEQEALSLADGFDDNPDLEQVAAHRTSSVPRLRRMMRGDLRLIAAKALRSEPSERYPSAAHFAEDLTRYLACLPISAAPPSWRYRARRWLTRHPWVGVLSAAFLLAVVVGTSATAWQMRQALESRDQALAEAEKSARLTDFLVATFAQADPNRTQGELVSAKSLLDNAVQRIDLELPRRDGVRADLLAAMASAYSGLALRDTQLKLSRQALAIERELNRPRVLTRRLLDLAKALRETGDAAAAMVLIVEAEARLVADSTDSRGYLGWLLYFKAITQFSLDQPDESERTLQQSLQVLTAAADAQADHISSVQLMLSRRWASAGNFEQALELVQSAVARSRLAEPAVPTKLVEALDALGSLYGKSERFSEQTATYREALALAADVYGAEHLHVAIVEHNLGLALEAQGDLANAMTHMRSASAVGLAAVAATHGFNQSAQIALLRLRCLNNDAADRIAEYARLKALSENSPRLQGRLATAGLACGFDGG